MRPGVLPLTDPIPMLRIEPRDVLTSTVEHHAKGLAYQHLQTLRGLDIPEGWPLGRRHCSGLVSVVSFSFQCFFRALTSIVHALTTSTSARSSLITIQLALLSLRHWNSCGARVSPRILPRTALS